MAAAKKDKNDAVMSTEFLYELKAQSDKNAYHLSVLNSEVGELRDAQLNMMDKLDSTRDQLKAMVVEVKDELKSMIVKLRDELKSTTIEVKNDVDWLKRFFWVIATASITTFVATIIKIVADIQK